MANSVDPDEMAHDDPFHLDLHCLHRHLFRSLKLKELRGIDTISREQNLMQLVLFPSANVSLLEQILSCQIRPLLEGLWCTLRQTGTKKKKKKKKKKEKKTKKNNKKKQQRNKPSPV